MTTSVREEASRKTLHLLLSLVAAAVVFVLPHPASATVLAAATLLALSIEAVRRVSDGFALLFHRKLGRLLRDREAGRLTGATTLSIGYTTAAVLFPGGPALAGILVAGIADAVAAVVGKRFGRLRYPGGKSAEGSAAFFVAVLVIALPLLPDVDPLAVLAVALVLTAIEALTLRVDDNLYLPIATAAAVHAAGLLTGSTLFP